MRLPTLNELIFRQYRKVRGYRGNRMRLGSKTEQLRVMCIAAGFTP